MLFVGKEKKTGVLANTCAKCHLFFTTVRNAKVYELASNPERGIYLSCFLMYPTLKAKASVFDQPMSLNLEYRFEDVFSEVHFKFRTWSRNPE